MSEPILLTESTKVPTPHNEAKVGDFAKTVLMPGDPQRAELVAKDFMTDAKLVNNVRGIQGYTGTYKGVPVSVMASGMGQPSIGIYSYELFQFYNVDNIIRIGSAGCYTPDLHLSDIMIGQAACTDGGFITQYRIDGSFSPIGDWDLMESAVNTCREKGYNFRVGNMVSSDRFYAPYDDIKKWTKMGCIGVEMEASALYCNAAYLGKRALAICTVSNSFVFPEEDMTAEERKTSMGKMIEVALETAVFADKLPECK